jgi:hypothetical protein
MGSPPARPFPPAGGPCTLFPSAVLPSAALAMAGSLTDPDVHRDTSPPGGVRAGIRPVLGSRPAGLCQREVVYNFTDFSGMGSLALRLLEAHP